MEAIFLKLVNMSLTASWLVLAVMLLRILLKNGPKYIRVILWGFVGIRLLFPFSLKSVFSLIPSTEPLPQEFLYAAAPQVNTGIPALNEAINPIVTQSLRPAALTSANPTQIWSFLFSVVWIIGMVLMLLYAAVSYFTVRRSVAASIRIDRNLRLCDHIDSPFILGIFSPTIYLPSELDPKTADMVLAHEYAHLKRKDHWWKPLGYVLLCVYWFNPMMWLAYILLCRDIELACDEKVIGSIGIDQKKAYSCALLRCSVSRKMIAACPLAFGEVDVRGRIQSVLNYKKPAFWILVLALVLCVAVAVCFLTDPLKQVDPTTLDNWGITITATDISPNGLTLRIQIPDNLDGDITIPTNQTVLELSEGSWVEVLPVSAEGDTGENLKLLFPSDDALYQQVEWKNTCGTLKAGEYRICKTLWLFRDGLGYQKDFYVDFTIPGGTDPTQEDAVADTAIVTAYPDSISSLWHENAHESYSVLYWSPLTNIRYDASTYRDSIIREAVMAHNIPQEASERVWLESHAVVGEFITCGLTADGDFLGKAEVYVLSQLCEAALVNGELRIVSTRLIAAAVSFDETEEHDLTLTGYCQSGESDDIESMIQGVFPAHIAADMKPVTEYTDAFSSHIRQQGLYYFDLVPRPTIDGLISTLADEQPRIYLALTDISHDEHIRLYGAPGWETSGEVRYAALLQNYAFVEIDPTEANLTSRQITMFFEESGEFLQLEFYEGSHDVLLYHRNSIFYYRAVSIFGDSCPIGDIMRSWIDDAEMEKLRAEIQPIEDLGQGHLVTASAFCSQYVNHHMQASPGSMYRYSYSFFEVEEDEEATRLARQRGELDENGFAFWLKVYFIPENTRALHNSMPGNTFQYEGTDPSIPEGAYVYLLCGYIHLTEQGWIGEILGTGF